MNETAIADTQLPEPEKARVIGRPFQKGQVANPHGRPRKGQTLADRLAKADAKVARKAIKARDERLSLTNMVGEQAWKTYLAYRVGLPAQKFIVTGPTQADALDQELDGVPLYIEGTSRLLTEGEAGTEAVPGE